MNTTLATERLQDLEADAPDALRLAQLVSLAVRVEPHFLRRMRLDLLPAADVGSEADLWFSPIIESRGSSSFVIDSTIALLLRRDLAREPETLEHAAKIIALEHRHMPALIQLEEQVHVIAARGGDDVLTRIDEAIAPALRALHEGTRAKEVARWAMRALPRFDPVVRKSGAVVALLLHASRLLGGRRIVRERTSSQAALNQFAGAIPAAMFSERARVALEVTDTAIRFVEDPGNVPVLELPHTTPLLVEVSWASGDARIVNLVEAEVGNAFQIDSGVNVLTLRALDGSEFLLQKQPAEQPRRAEKQIPPLGKDVPARYDLFFSSRSHDYLDRARPLLDALASRGLRVYKAAPTVPEGASITQQIRGGIASSKVLLAFYSSTYPLSSACQEEIISAWLAAQQAGEPPQARVRIINPEPGFDHIPGPLRDLKAYPLPHDPAGLAMLADELRTHADSLEDGLSAAAQQVLPDYHGMAPVHAPHFVGRVRELWELHGKLTGNRININSGVYGKGTVQVRGLGGNGKSLLAHEYALRFGPAYPGGVFWLNAYGNDDSQGALDEESRLATRQDQLRRFALDLGVTIEGLKPEEIEVAFWRQLEASGRPCLWIVDDVPSGISASDLQRHWFAPGSNVSTLITTRSREYGSLGEHLDLDLGVLSPEEALTLLTRHRRPENDSEKTAARQLTEALGCHPLAVEIAGNYLAKVGNSFQQYLDELTDPGQDALEYGALLRDSLPTGHDRSITRTLLKSIQLLGQEGRDFLRLASELAVAPISSRFLQEVFEAVGVKTGVPEAVLLALDQADSLSLCEKVGHDGWRVHPLVSRVVRFGSVDKDRVEQLRKAAVGVLCRRLSVAGDVREHSGIANEVAHARHLTATGLVADEDATLASWIARHDYERGDYAGARVLQEQVLAARARLLGKEHPDTLTAMQSLAQTLYAQGDLAGARQLQEQALEAWGRLLGREHPDTLTAMHDLALTLEEQGELIGARKLQEQVLEARGELLGKEHPDTLRAMGNLAPTLRAQGELAGARKLQEQVLEASVRLLGKEHPDTLLAMHNLAGTLEAQGELAGARKLQEQVLEARDELLGKEHPDTLRAMGNLALTLRAQGELAGARKLQEQALETLVRLLGKEHPDTLRAMGNLALTLEAQGEMAGARKLQEQTLEVEQTGRGQVEGYGSIVRQRLANLAREYEEIRDSMQAGDERTQRMAVVVEEMKSQAISSYPLLQELAASSAPGERLAAISILQVLPNPQMLSWLAERPALEMPFVAYHATVALLMAVRNLAGQYYREVRLALDQAKTASSQGIHGFDRDRDKILELAEHELERRVRL
jgi:hypothetical protein